MNKIYDTYDDIAYFYNKYWTARPHILMAKAMDILLIPRLKKKAKILDICCGSGNMAAYLCKKGFNITGVDGSKLMLDYASKNAPEAKFICADARDFNAEDKFNAALCLFDSINHILKGEDLVKIFKNAFIHLSKDGFFIFDANTLKSASEASDMDFFKAEDDEVFMIKCDYDKGAEITSYRSTFFIKEGGLWRRGDALVEEKYYSHEVIIDSLKSAGFKNITFADGASFGIRPFKDRLFFYAEKTDG